MSFIEMQCKLINELIEYLPHTPRIIILVLAAFFFSCLVLFDEAKLLYSIFYFSVISTKPIDLESVDVNTFLKMSFNSQAPPNSAGDL